MAMRFCFNMMTNFCNVVIQSPSLKGMLFSKRVYIKCPVLEYSSSTYKIHLNISIKSNSNRLRINSFHFFSHTGSFIKDMQSDVISSLIWQLKGDKVVGFLLLWNLQCCRKEMPFLHIQNYTLPLLFFSSRSSLPTATWPCSPRKQFTSCHLQVYGRNRCVQPCVKNGSNG